MSVKESQRVTVHEERPVAFGSFKRVEIRYSDGSVFYQGWIQDYGDARTGPTFFEQNYKLYDLAREQVFKLEKYWQPLSFNQPMLALRDATAGDLDDLVDLTFQNYFDGGYNRISAYQGLNHQVDEDHITLALTVKGTIYAYLYIDLKMYASRRQAYFDSLFCAHCLRNKGAGQALLAAGVERVRGQGFAKVSGKIIGSPEHCERIAKMLDKHGFKVVECAQMTDDAWEAEMLKTF